MNPSYAEKAAKENPNDLSKFQMKEEEYTLWDNVVPRNGPEPDESDRSNEKAKKKKSLSTDRQKTVSRRNDKMEVSQKRKMRSKESIASSKYKGKSTAPPLRFTAKTQETMIRSLFKKTSQKQKLFPRTKNLESLYCPDEISQNIDVADEYHSESQTSNAVPEVVIVNNENNGTLFVKGRPFWCLKDEKPPVVTIVPFTKRLKEIVDGRLKLLKEISDPKDLDAYNTVEVMAGRDMEYFQKPNRLLSNTVRSLVHCNEMIKPRKLEDSNKSLMVSTITISAPEKVLIYNRKNRTDPPAILPFTPRGKEKKKKKFFSSLLKN